MPEATKTKKPTTKDLQWKTNDRDFARLYRPKRFDEIVGQPMIVHQIKGMVKRRQIPGAMLIHGTRGSGKTTFARLISAILNCSNLGEDGNPCLECTSCKAMYAGNQNNNNDYLEINCAENTGIDNIRALKERISYKPRFNRLAVVLDECHALSKAAQSMLLKVCEDAPAHVTFILITTEPQGIIDTLQSRCAKTRLAEVPTEKNVELLKRVCKAENIKLETSILEMICARSNNIPRDCLTGLQCVASALESEGVDSKNVTVDAMEARLAEMVGAPSYVSVQKFLVGVYTGKLVAALESTSTSQSKPIFLRSCIDTHTNVLLSLSTAKPEKLISEKWVLGYTSKIRSESGLERDEASVKAMGLFLNDMLDTYTKMNQYQLGDSAAPIVALAAKWCLKFKETK